MDDCYARAKAIIMSHEDILHKAAKLLLEKEKSADRNLTLYLSRVHNWMLCKITKNEQRDL